MQQSFGDIEKVEINSKFEVFRGYLFNTAISKIKAKINLK